MSHSVILDVQTEGIGSAPILGHYFEKLGIAEIIDENVPLDPRMKGLTCGHACVAMITYILFQVLRLYRLCKFAKEIKFLEVIFPDIAPNEYFDDRLADTLDTVQKAYSVTTTDVETYVEQWQNLINL